MQGSQGVMSREEEMRFRITQGRPPLFTDMRIVNDEGNELPRDGKATGDLEVRGPHVVKGYFRVSEWQPSACFCMSEDLIATTFH